MRKIVLIAHNLRSCHNVGSLLRTAEGLGVATVYLTGYTPYPTKNNDTRLPHLAAKIHKQIEKTALGAQDQINWKQNKNVFEVIEDLKQNGFQILALEQTETSVPLPEYKPSKKLAIILGREVEGMEVGVLDACHKAIEIPMFGKKESFNVVQAAAMALYHCRFS